jgi:hypothetical protein
VNDVELNEATFNYVLDFLGEYLKFKIFRGSFAHHEATEALLGMKLNILSTSLVGLMLHEYGHLVTSVDFFHLLMQDNQILDLWFIPSTLGHIVVLMCCDGWSLEEWTKTAAPFPKVFFCGAIILHINFRMPNDGRLDGCFFFFCEAIFSYLKFGSHDDGWSFHLPTGPKLPTFSQKACLHMNHRRKGKKDHRMVGNICLGQWRAAFYLVLPSLEREWHECHKCQFTSNIYNNTVYTVGKQIHFCKYST